MLLFILALLITIIAHELGHLIASLFCKVEVEKFSIGFGRPAFGFQWKKIKWQITPWILGGYVQLKGENSLVPNGFLVQKYCKKMIIVLAGVTINLLIAVICWIINYQNLKIGLFVDWTVFQSLFTQDFHIVKNLIITLQPNEFLFQLSILNFSCFILNLLPIPALDGSFIFLCLMEKIWKENYVKYLNRLTSIFFWILMIGQFLLIAWIYLK